MTTKQGPSAAADTAAAPAVYSALLPEALRPSTSRVRVLKPQLVLLDFHGTMVERRWEDKVIFPYVRQAINQYLQNHKHLEAVQRFFTAVKVESFEQHFTYRNEDAPLVGAGSSPDDDQEEENLAELIRQMGDFVRWQMDHRRETRETQAIIRLTWVHGLQKGHIKTPLYDDTLAALKRWHDKPYNCRLYVISSLDEDTLQMLLGHTVAGNLNVYLSGYLCAKQTGDKRMSEFYANFYKQHIAERDMGHQRARPAAAPSNAGRASGHLSGSRESVQSASSAVSWAPALSARPVLFITDSGQEAKAACQAIHGTAFEALLMNRPGNKRFRLHYLSYCNYVNSFNDVEFVT